MQGSASWATAQGRAKRSPAVGRPPFPFTNLRGRVAQAKMSAVTVPSHVRGPPHGSTNRGQTPVAWWRSSEV